MNPKIFGQQTIVQDEQYNLYPQLRQIHDMMRNTKCIFGDYGFVNPTIFNNLIIGPFLKYRNRQCPPLQFDVMHAMIGLRTKYRSNPSFSEWNRVTCVLGVLAES